MSLEATVSRRELITFFAKRSKGNGNRSLIKDSPFGTPTPPNNGESGWIDKVVTRRTVLGGIATIVTGGAAWYAADTLSLINKFFEEQPIPDTLEGLVAEAKKMEGSFRDKDLSNKHARNRYTHILAAIYDHEYPGYLSVNELIPTLIWTDTEEEYAQKSGVSPSESNRGAYDISAASTLPIEKLIIINANSDIFKQEFINRINSPMRINSFTTLRIVMLHEFGHLVTLNRDDLLFKFLDPNNEINDKRIEGFRVIGQDNDGQLHSLFDVFHEASVELISKDLNQRLFDSFFSNYQTDNGSVTTTMHNIEKIIQLAGISMTEFKKFHGNSNLKEFLLLLTERAGDDQRVPELIRLRAGINLMIAAEKNDQVFIQQYIEAVNSNRRKMN